MFATLSRSWEFAKISYGIIWDFKSLVLFPIFSTIAAAFVLASFALPLWGTGTFERWMQLIGEHENLLTAANENPVIYVVLFLLYFANYFVIVFFNSALTACAMQVIEGQAPTVGGGLAVATKRLPQIAGWALISAVIGVVLKVIENSHKRGGQIVAMLIGTAWTALTYFAVPVLVVDGVGPIEAIKRSAGTLRKTWGDALAGNFSLGFLSLLVALPAILLCVGFGFVAVQSGSTAGMIIAGVLVAVVIVIASAFSSAADVVFKALLYNYATGKSLPQGVDTTHFDEAFRRKD